MRMPDKKEHLTTTEAETDSQGSVLSVEQSFLAEMKDLDDSFTPESPLEYFNGLDLKTDRKLFRFLNRFLIEFEQGISSKHPHDESDLLARSVAVKTISREVSGSQVFTAVREAINRYADFSHLSDGEVAAYKKHQAECSGKKGFKAYEACHWLRERFIERSDQEFLQSLSGIHWCSSIDGLKKTLSDPYVQGSEMSCEGYLPSEETISRWGKGIGVMLKGDVVWAANSDARSDNKFVDADGMTHKYSWGDGGRGMGLILDDDTFLRVEERSGHNELVINKWKAQAIVVDFQRLRKLGASISEKLSEIAVICRDNQLSLIDSSGEPIDLDSILPEAKGELDSDETNSEISGIKAERFFLDEIKSIDPNFRAENAAEYLSHLDLRANRALYRPLSRFVRDVEAAFRAKHPLKTDETGWASYEDKNANYEARSKELKANELLGLALDALSRYSYFSHLSEREIEEYEEQNALSRGKEGFERYRAWQAVRDKFADRCNTEFLQSLNAVHWCTTTTALKKTLEDPYVQGSEMSCEGYLPSEESFCHWANGIGIGVKIKGDVIWAANSDSKTDNKYVDPDGMTHKYPGPAIKGLILDDESFLRVDERVHPCGTPHHNELLVDNWSVDCVVIDFKRLKKNGESFADELSNLVEICREHNLPIVDVSGESFDIEDILLS